MNPSNPLIEITAKQHNVFIDLVYASPNNLIGKPVYATAHCWLHREAEPHLRRAVEIAALARLRLKIFDAYRPPRAQEVFWQHLPDPRYVADIARGSNHSRGVALDLTLVDEAGKDLDMGTAFDAMIELSHHFNPELAPQVHRNRLWLLGIMTQAGFKRIDSEWWHYELPEALEYPLIADDTLLGKPASAWEGHIQDE
jgi:D-alanyl-D-alanine dipeptidase